MDKWINSGYPDRSAVEIQGLNSCVYDNWVYPEVTPGGSG